MIYKGSCKTEDWINDAKNIYKYIYIHQIQQKCKVKMC